ncbi:hypothetical protein CAI21_11230 [Alkalilimnicola ehrlichii]|uniref:Outer membrane efflux protein n=1 Tax=Alkalilimnicola ehrlichii TaxID=351052 RepID=A0A3E0X280_9GAMM|nr:hypothetical protein CAI21_11230 [Alkalilimnicola ehrlichii]RFA38648.1 hypothetical protein CAL65_04780 [Alkalilimnicola ehrlichii]
MRQLFLELTYLRQASDVLEENRGLFENLVDLTQREFAAGTTSQQDVLEAELELRRLEERISIVQEQQALALAELARWIGAEAARRPLSDELPELPDPPRYFSTHPILDAEQALVEASLHAVELAQEGYRPQWSVELGYGYAPGGMTDNSGSFSGMVMVDLPLLSRARVNSEVAAERHRYLAAQQAYIERQRALGSQWEGAMGRWQQLLERERRYEQRLLEPARRNAEAAEQAYRAGTIPFRSLIRARVTDLETRLEALRVMIERRQLQAELLYLAGGQAL